MSEVRPQQPYDELSRLSLRHLACVMAMALLCAGAQAATDNPTQMAEARPNPFTKTQLKDLMHEGDVYFNCGMTDDACRTYLRVLKEDKEGLLARSAARNILLVFAVPGDVAVDRCRKWMAEVLPDPNDQSYLILEIGEFYYRTDRYDRSLEETRLLVRQDTANGCRARVLSAICLLSKGDKTGAAGALKRSVDEKAPPDVRMKAQYLLDMLEAQRDELAEVLAVRARAVWKGPDTPVVTPSVATEPLSKFDQASVTEMAFAFDLRREPTAGAHADAQLPAASVPGLMPQAAPFATLKPVQGAVEPTRPRIMSTEASTESSPGTLRVPDFAALLANVQGEVAAALVAAEVPRASGTHQVAGIPELISAQAFAHIEINRAMTATEATIPTSVGARPTASSLAAQAPPAIEPFTRQVSKQLARELIRKGDALWQEKRADEARSAYAQALRVESKGAALGASADRLVMTFTSAEEIAEGSCRKWAAQEFSDIILQRRVELAIGEAYFWQKRCAQAVQLVDSLIQEGGLSGEPAEFAKCLSTAGRGRQAEALEQLQDLAEKAQDVEIAAKARFLAGWLHLQAHEDSEARVAFEMVAAKYSESTIAAKAMEWGKRLAQPKSTR